MFLYRLIFVARKVKGILPFTEMLPLSGLFYSSVSCNIHQLYASISGLALSYLVCEKTNSL